MPKEIQTWFPIEPKAVLHLPWQGCWQVRADRLRSPVDLVGAHLPLMTWETPGGWMLARFQAGDDDAVWGLRLAFAKGQMTATLTGDWQQPPTWTTQVCRDRDDLIGRIRAALPPPAPRGEPFERAFILDIHIVRGDLVQRFEDVTDFIAQCADLGIARGSMFYLPGWAGPFDGNYPDYVAAEDAGGSEGLARLAATARAQGARVVPHLNHWALTHSRAVSYPQFDAHILRDANGAKAGWPGVALMNLTHPLWYVDPGSEPWLEHMDGRLAYLEKLGVDTVYCDQVAPPLGDNWRRQTRRFVREIHRRHPRMILGSESVHADVLDALGFAQLWGPVWSAMPEVAVLKPSRLLADVVKPWMPIVGHLATPAPYPAPYAWTNFVQLAELGPARMFRKIWEFHEASGVVPTARLVTTRRRANARVLKEFFVRPVAAGQASRQTADIP